VSKNRLNPTV